MSDPLETPDDDTIDEMIEEAAEKRNKGQPDHTGAGNPDGRPYADYKPCPLCGTEVLELPAHLPCDSD